MSSARAAKLSAHRVTMPRDHGWHRLPVVSGLVGVAALVASIVLGLGNSAQFYFSYLVAFVFVLSIALGALFFVLLQFVTRSGWSVVVRRGAENMMGVLPLFVLLFVPVALGVHTLYHWAHADAVAADRVLQHKAAYLNEPFFYARAAVYLVAWGALGWWFRSQSVTQDRTSDHAITRRLQTASAPALIVFALTTTFAAFDWLMSLDPHWFSTIFGVYFFAGCTVSALAALAVLSTAMQRAGLTAGVVTAEHYHDIGKLMFGFVAFWAYIAFSQYFLIWYANIPEETWWFIHRWEGSWRNVSLAVALAHFVVPFFFLLPRSIKRRGSTLVVGAVWVLAAHYIDVYWLVMPTLHKHGAYFSVLDVTTVLSVGGLFVAGVTSLSRRQALVPVGDPRLAESLRFENM